MSFTNHGAKTYAAGGTIRNKRLVVRTANQDEVVEATNAVPARGFVGIAYLNRASIGAGEFVAVKPLCTDDTLWAVAAGNVAVGDKLFAAADGKLSTTPVAGAFVGYAEEAGVADQEFEFRPAVEAVAVATAVDLAALVARVVALEA